MIGTLLGKVKTYGLFILSGLIAVLFALVKYKSSQVEGLKQKARETRLQAKLKQAEQVNKTVEAYKEAHQKGAEKLEQVKKDIASGKRTGFGQLRD